MTYAKLHSSAQYLPKSILERTWQPPQLLRAMLQLDPYADQALQLHMGPIAVEGVTPRDDEYQLVGEHKPFGLAWLRKHYNKLGSFLHLQQSGKVDEAQLREYLKTVASEIEEAQKALILSIWFGQTIKFTCDLCGEESSVSEHYARTEGIAHCLNPTCELEYVVSIRDQGIFLIPRIVSLKCHACGEETRLHQSTLKRQTDFACTACKRVHVIRCRWEYGVVKLPESQGSQGTG